MVAAALLFCGWSIRRRAGVTAVVGLAQKSPSSGTQFATSGDTVVLRDIIIYFIGYNWLLQGHNELLQGHN